MAFRGRADDREHRLDPVRWRGPARRGALLRAGTVAVLLAAAAAVLYSGGPPGECPPPPPAPSAKAPVAARTPGAAGRGRPAPPHGTVGVALTPADPAVLGVLSQGDRVDVLATGAGDDPATLATNALVIGAPEQGALYLAMLPEQARRVAGAPPAVRLTVLVRP